MKAVVFEEHGGVDKLMSQDVPEPRPSPGEVVIKVRAASANYNDVWARQGLPGVEIILPHISGSDVSGEVVEVQVTPDGSPAANYAYAVTPARLVTGRIAERGAMFGEPGERAGAVDGETSGQVVARGARGGGLDLVVEHVLRLLRT